MTRDLSIETSVTPLAPLDALLRRRLIASMHGLRGCELVIEDGSERFELGTSEAGSDLLRAQVTIRDRSFYRAVALNGSVGAAEAFMDGAWECDDLVALVRILVRNRDRLDAMERGVARVGGALMRAWAAFRRNTLAGSRRNIAAHYDLGNEFFALFLDANLMYSSAMFAREDEPLDIASERKIDRICTKLGLSSSMHVLEIGSGWGGFALHAARQYGCRVTTATISREQYDLARRRVHEAGLDERVEVVLADYRELCGVYDRVVSIEMIEAIGARYLDTYFAKVGSLLRDDGLALIQAITIEDSRYEQALRSVDFIKRHVFPGSFIPSIAAMTGSVARSSDLCLVHLEDFGASYAYTLRAWRERFLARRGEVLAQGYPERFARMWEFYLAYCEGGMRERSTGVVQMVLARPGHRPGHDAGIAA